uniref:VQ domain-containing protein n=1 Tax=Kalanchoe fedtschenkoi TaxID=63787 RepID=A0A7N0SY07_KALFE
MEPQHRSSYYTSPLNSPSSYGSSSTSINPLQTPPLTPKAISRSDPSSPYPTTFVQADITSFKQVVQMLTGSSEPPKQTLLKSDFTFSKSSIPPVRSSPQKKQPSSKLYERRNQLRNNLMINTLVSGVSKNNNSHSVSPRHQEILSPSMLDFPKLALSPVTPLMEDIFTNKSSTPSTANSNSSEEEEKAIAEKGFYFHPSPRTSTTPKGAEPQLLPLFPVTAQPLSGTS